MVTASGFSSAPATRIVLVLIVAASLCASILELKPYLPIRPYPHLWPYLQLWRTLSFQLAYSSSSELLFASAVLYQIRALERIWGSRKFASFLITSYALCMLGIVGTGLLFKIITFGWWGYIPSGMSAVVIAAVVVWGQEIPRLGGFKILLDDDMDRIRQGTARGFEVTDKWTIYLLTAQLALSQFPYGLVPALVGWVIGNAWTEELVPAGLVRWRLPAWMVGEDSRGKRSGQRQYEGLRRRLEEENQDGMRVVSEGMARQEPNQDDRRGFLGGVGRYFTSGG